MYCYVSFVSVAFFCFFILLFFYFFFFFNDTATTEIYTLSLHDALPISPADGPYSCTPFGFFFHGLGSSTLKKNPKDRKSTRLNSSHSQISYAVFCLKKKKKKKKNKNINNKINNNTNKK